MRLTTKLLLAGVLAAIATPALADGWDVEQLPNAGGACAARLAGDKLDLMLLLNNAGKLVLSGGHPDWKVSGEGVSKLSIDGGPPQKLKVSAVGNLYLGLVTDAQAAKLRASHTLDWTLPNGRFQVASTGLGAAMDGVKTCSAKG